MILGSKLWACQVGIQRDLQLRCPNLDQLASPPTPFQRKTKCGLPCCVSSDNGVASDQHPSCFAPNVFLEVPRLGLLADEQDKAPNLIVPMLGRPIICLWQLPDEGLCELWHLSVFCR